MTGTSKQMNIIFILSDDQGAWAMNCAGFNQLHTPNLDRLAETGVRFSNAFCVSPVCSPARASILTGTIPSFHGVHDWIRAGSLNNHQYPELAQTKLNGKLASNDPVQYLKGKPAYTEILNEQGYNCALSGKWHLGDSLTPQHGFSSWKTIGRGGCPYYQADLAEDGEIRHSDEYVTDTITNWALDDLEKLTSEDKPFYLSVHYTAPHAPWDKANHPEEWIDYYKHEAFPMLTEQEVHPNQNPGIPNLQTTEGRMQNLQGYCAAISAMDEGIGRILDKVETLSLQDQTIVVFTSDNGMNMGHHGIWGKGNGTFPLNLYDTAVKIPLIIQGPVVHKDLRGSTSDALVSHYDLFPTILEIANIKEEMLPQQPGSSMMPLLRNVTTTEADKAVVVFDEYGPNRMIRTQEWKYIHRYPYGPHELYHLASDPDEKNNLSGLEEHYQREAMLRDSMRKWFQKYADLNCDGSVEGVTGEGQLRQSGRESNGLITYYS